MTRGESELIGFAATSLASLVSPLRLAAESEPHFIRFLGGIGWKAPSPGAAGQTAFAGALDAAAEAVAAVRRAIEDDFEARAALAQLTPMLGRLAGTLVRADLGGPALPPAAPDISRAFAEDVLEFLILDFLRREYPGIFRLAIMFEIVVMAQPVPLFLSGGASPASTEDPIVRLPVSRLAVDRAVAATLATAPLERAGRMMSRARERSGGSLDPGSLLAAAGEAVAADLGALAAAVQRDFHCAIDPSGVTVSIPGVVLADTPPIPVSVPLPSGRTIAVGLGARGGRLRLEWPSPAGLTDSGWTLLDLDALKLRALTSDNASALVVEMADGALRLEIRGRAALELPAGMVAAMGNASLAAEGGASLLWTEAEGMRLELQRLASTATDVRLGDCGIVLRDAAVTIDSLRFPLPAAGPPWPLAISAEGEFRLGEDGRIAVKASLDNGSWSLSSTGEMALGGGLRLRGEGDLPILSAALREDDRKVDLAISGRIELPKKSTLSALAVTGTLAIEDGMLSGGIGAEAAGWEIAEGLVCEKLSFRAEASHDRLRARLAATIPLGSGFTLELLDQAPPGASARPGLTLEREGTAWTAVATGGIRLDFPPEVLAEDDDSGASAAAFGTLRLSTDPSRPVQVEDVALQFHADHASLGGGSPLALEQVDLLVTNVGRLLAADAADPRPVATFSATVRVTADDPDIDVALVIEEGQLIFETPGGLPLFRLKDGGSLGCSASLPAAMPLRIRSATITFEDTDRPISELFEPDNVIIGFGAELAISTDRMGGFNAGVEGVKARMLNGRPHLSLEGIFLGVQDLPLGVLTVSGGLGIHNLDDPLNLQIEGVVGGTVYGAGVKVLAALKAVDGFIEPLGACLDVGGGPGGIVLPWGFMITGASGGVSFANTNGNPCDFRTYSRAREPREAIRPDSPASRTRPKPFEGCACCDCPPTSMNVLCQPHPDQRLFPGRVILKFSSIDESMWTGLPAPGGSGTLGDWVRARDREFAAAGASAEALVERQAEAVASGLVSALQSLVGGRIGPVGTDAVPPAPPGLPAEVVAAMTAPVVAWMQDARTELTRAIRSAAGAAGEGKLYGAVRDALYRGVTCRDATLQVTGTFSHASVSAFLSVTGGISVSTAGSIGVIGRLNLLSIPIGHLNGFLIGTSATGDPEPQLCGDLRLELGPVRFGMVGAQLRCPGLVTASADLVARHLGGLSPKLLKRALAAIDTRAPDDPGRIDRRPGFMLLNKPAQSLKLLTAGEAAGLLANLADAAAAEGRGAAKAVSKALRDLTAELWGAFQPEFSFCGQAAPSIFGIRLAELAQVSGRITKDHFHASVSFSPLYVIGRFIPLADLFSGMDKAKLEASMTLPRPEDLGLEVLSGWIRDQGDLERFLADGLERVLRDAAFTASYELSPLGLPMSQSVARLVMPFLTPHPTSRSSDWQNPDRVAGLPSRRAVLFAALDKKKLGAAEWNGDIGSILPLPAGTGDRELQRHYFPHGGVLGAGRLDIPRLLTRGPPWELIDKLGQGKVLERLEAGLKLVKDYILKADPVATLAFYAPFPNPPALSRDLPPGTESALHVRKVHELIARQGLDPSAIASSAYASDLAFFEGEAQGRLLGIDLGRAEVRWIPPSASAAAGALRVRAAIGDDAWLGKILEVGFLEFDMTLSPDLAGMARTARPTVAAAFKSFDTGSRPVRESQAPQLLASLLETMAMALPKLALRSSVSLHTPSEWRDFLTFDTHATLEAYSPFFDPGAQGSSPAAAARRNGGIVLTGGFRLKLGPDWSFASSAALALTAPDAATGLPRLRGEVAVADTRGLSLLGWPLRLGTARLSIDTAPSAGAAYLSLDARTRSINCGVVTALPVGGDTIDVKVEARPRRGAVALSMRLAPFRIASPFLSDKTPVLASGAASAPSEIVFGENGGGAALHAPAGLTLLGTGGIPILTIGGEIRGEAAVDRSGRWSLSFALPRGIEATLLPEDARVRRTTTLASPVSLAIAPDGNFQLDIEMPALALAGDWLALHGAAGPNAPVKLRITPRGIGLAGAAKLRLAPPLVSPSSALIEEFALGPGGVSGRVSRLPIPAPMAPPGAGAEAPELGLSGDLALRLDRSGLFVQIEAWARFYGREWRIGKAEFRGSGALAFSWNQPLRLTAGPVTVEAGGGWIRCDYGERLLHLHVDPGELRSDGSGWPEMRARSPALDVRWRNGLVTAAAVTVAVPVSSGLWRDADPFRFKLEGGRVAISLEIGRSQPEVAARLRGGSLEIASKATHEGRPLAATRIDLPDATIRDGTLRLQLAPWGPPDILKGWRDACKLNPSIRNCDSLFPRPPRFEGLDVRLNLSDLIKFE